MYMCQGRGYLPPGYRWKSEKITYFGMLPRPSSLSVPMQVGALERQGCYDELAGL